MFELIKYQTRLFSPHFNERDYRLSTNAIKTTTQSWLVNITKYYFVPWMSNNKINPGCEYKKEQQLIHSSIIAR